jgi:hypothetical protein
MWIVNTWHWLVNEGLLRDIVAVVSAGVVSPVIAVPVKRFQNTQKDIADKLDTSTPGGLKDVVDMLHATQGGTMGSVGVGPGGDSGAS